MSTEPTLSDEQREELLEVFRYFDTDHSGAIDITELERLMDALGADVSPLELKIAAEALDTDHNGSIDFDEFADWWSGR
jgi:Ca2+-binding EF-hand superfamily protein